jgi:hypothetical protein
MKLYDGNLEIKCIHVLGMYRKNEIYLNSFLADTLNEMEKLYDNIEFRYYFIENNSDDETQEALKNIIKNKKNSKLFIYNLKKDYKNIGDGRNFNRTSTLAKIRNKLVDGCIPFPENEWCLFIDSNIYFKPTILSNIFLSCKKPSDDNIGMMCMYTQQLLIPNIHSNTKEPVLMKHFYDTYSFYDKNKHTFYPECAFDKCLICSKKPSEVKRIPLESNITDISSGFGGFVFIKSDILNNSNIRWGTVCYNKDNNQSLCEHVLFCDRLRSITNKRIVILQNVDSLYRTV